jgi:hypothetical protein
MVIIASLMPEYQIIFSGIYLSDNEFLQGRRLPLLDAEKIATRRLELENDLSDLEKATIIADINRTHQVIKDLRD